MSDVRTQDAPTMTDEKRGLNPPGSFIWYELMTTDAEGAKAFYDAVVGWTIGEASPEFQGYRMIGRSDGKFNGGVLPLTDEMQQHGARPMWLGYLNVDDVDATAASIEGAGGKTLMKHDIPNVGRIAMVADPQGVPFYIMKPIPPANDPNARSDVYSREAPQRVAWNELMTSDQAGALDFYLGQFGWTKGDAMPMGEMGTYQLVSHDGDSIGAIMTKAPDKPSRWRFYIRVDDVDRSKSTIESKGGTVVHGPMEVPGGDRVLIGIDPHGAEFALVGGI
ncbi:MAG TPA: VOC family protein [Sphingomicrobium sp.]|nr:VOC family protein [Sphingomicrobium sp.]